MVMLARNSDVQGAVNSIQHLEDRFNRKRRYPWVFLNDEPFDDEFKRFVLHAKLLYLLTRARRRVRLQTDSEVFFGEIPKEHWVQQEWINETLAAENRKKMGEFWFVPYTGTSLNPRHSVTWY
jgi:alpha 1,2-mannosyltransferase